EEGEGAELFPSDWKGKEVGGGSSISPSLSGEEGQGLLLSLSPDSRRRHGPHFSLSPASGERVGGGGEPLGGGAGVAPAVDGAPPMRHHEASWRGWRARRRS